MGIKVLEDAKTAVCVKGTCCLVPCTQRRSNKESTGETRQRPGPAQPVFLLEPGAGRGLTSEQMAPHTSPCLGGSIGGRFQVSKRKSHLAVELAALQAGELVERGVQVGAGQPHCSRGFSQLRNTLTPAALTGKEVERAGRRGDQASH